MTAHATDPADRRVIDGRFRVDNIAEPVFGAQVGPGYIRPHPLEKCAGRDEPCVIHRPSDHHMRGWPFNWRADRGLMERTCPHGIGHPDPDDLTWREDAAAQAIHGCDGCCEP